MWFINLGSIGRITTAGVVSNYTDARISSPQTITAGPDGALWFTTGGDQGSIGRITTAGAVSIYSDASISGALDIRVGPDGALWFTNITAGSIGRITTAGNISHYTVPIVTSPSGITAGPDGALWFTTYDEVWRVTTTGTFTRYRAPGSQSPFGITSGPDGALWFTNGGNDSIGRVDPAGNVTNYTGVGIVNPGSITTGPDGALWFTNDGNEVYGQPDAIGRITTAGAVTIYTDPSISGPHSIIPGPDGALWFLNSGSVGRITTAGTVTSYTDAGISGPAAITLGPDNALWFTNSNNSIGRMTTAGIVTNIYTNPFISNPIGITAGSDGALWFTNHGYNANWVGRITTAGTITHINAVVAFSIASGPDGALWLTDPGDNLVGRVTTNGFFTSYFDPTINDPYGIVSGPDGAMWFANYGNDSIGRITVPTTPNPTVPDPPTNVSATGGNGTATVSFTPPVVNGGAPITGYTATCTSSDGGVSGSESSGGTQFTVLGLTKGHTYQCTVVAMNVVGPSVPSAASNTFVLATVPGSPTNVAATPGVQNAVVTWDAPASDGLSPIVSYSVKASPGGQNATVSAPDTHATVTGLTPGATYTFTVTATNGIGTGAPSAASSAVTLPGSVTVPDAPTNVHAVAGNHQVTLQWTPPANNGGAGITSWTITMVPGPAPVTIPNIMSSLVIPNLTNGVAYTFSVHASNSAGAGPESAASAPVTPIGPPATPTNVIAFAGSGVALVSWVAPSSDNASPITGYTITTDPYTPTSPPLDVPGDQTAALITGLTNGVSYTFSVYASNPVANSLMSQQSNAVTPAGAPSAPDSVHASSSHGAASVSWTAPDANGSAITAYTVSAAPSGKTITVSGGTTHASFSSLAPGKHTFKVQAKNAAGTSPWSSASNPVTIAAPTTNQGNKAGGYWMLGADGKVYAFGAAKNQGSAPGRSVAIAARKGGTGYWTVDAAGNVSHFGSATDHGGHPALRSGESVSTISASPSGNGYWLFTNRGRAFAYGDAHFYGDMSAATLNGPVVASVATPTGHGYFMVGSDGGVFSFGDARFHGSTGGIRLNRPIVGISPTSDNRGYWLVASDGGVFAFNAPFRGSMGAVHLNRPVNGLVAYGNGYLMVASDGGVFAFSDKPFAGSLASNPPSAPIIGIATA